MVQSQPIEQDRTHGDVTRKPPSQIALVNIQSCPTSQAATPTHATRLPASRTSPRSPIGQTDRRTGPLNDLQGIAPTPSRRKQPRHCLQGRARPHAPSFFFITLIINIITVQNTPHTRSASASGRLYPCLYHSSIWLVCSARRHATDRGIGPPRPGRAQSRFLEQRSSTSRSTSSRVFRYSVFT